LRDFLENLLPGKWLGLGFLITAVVLCMGELVAPKVREMRSTEAKASDALMVGVAQALALLPGASRSGLTITAGRASGFTKVYAAKFSFLLSAVAILGGTLVQLPGVLKNGMGGIEMVPIIIGAAAAALSGMLAITFLVKLLKKGNLVWFAFYTAALGLMVFWEIIPA
ncbi:MAG: undecaprenyl-diphosphate phosphatase, partial [Clostridia bacterium]|nr:undecaprenyl-diphosphate phosphatase [Clostridia bacterium]